MPIRASLSVALSRAVAGFVEAARASPRTASSTATPPDSSFVLLALRLVKRLAPSGLRVRVARGLQRQHGLDLDLRAARQRRNLIGRARRIRRVEVSGHDVVDLREL